jgi:hypothetical protein
MSVTAYFERQRPWSFGAAGAFKLRADFAAASSVSWWLGIPFFLLMALPVVTWLAPEFYHAWVIPEGYGILELMHFFVPLVGFLVGVRLLFATAVRADRLWWTLILLGTLACFYTAGEEHSWGQHFFHWQTPETWSSLNRQNETNLHNSSQLFNVLPRAMLEIAILALGIIYPLASWMMGPLRIAGLEPFIPSLKLVPVSIGALVYKLDATAQKSFGMDGLVIRPAEAAETFYVLFMLFYLILISRRLAAGAGR